MKRWTVMLVPQDGHGATRTLNFHIYQLWVLAGLLIVLTFTASFMTARTRAMSARAKHFEQENRQLRMQAPHGAEDRADGAAGLSEQQRRQIVESLRAEYEARQQTLSALLLDVLETENRVRQISGLSPRSDNFTERLEEAIGDGRGGTFSEALEIAHLGAPPLERPPSLIYGLSRPSADAIIQEINLRNASLQHLIQGLEAQTDMWERTPSILPASNSRTRITSRFGLRRDPFGRAGIRHHNGLDIAGPPGSQVWAVARGTVVEAGWDSGGLGNVVRIDHGNGIETVFGHLQRCLVSAGDEVERRTPIGLLGSTGRSTGPHVHYEVYINGKAVDPERFIGN